MRKRRQDYYRQGVSTVFLSNSEVRNNQTSVPTDQLLLMCTLPAAATCHRRRVSGAIRCAQLLLGGVWTRGIVVRVLRTATVCIGTAVEEPFVHVSDTDAVCYSITETYDNER